MRGAAAVVLGGCLLIAACGGQQEQLRAADVSPLQTAAAPSASSTASTPSPVESSAPPVLVQPSASDSPPPAVAQAPPPTAETSQPDHGAALWTTQWRAVDRTKGGQPWPFPAEAAWTARFESATTRVIAWRGGCNTTGAGVVVSADRLTVGQPEGSTAVGCPDDRLEEDEQAAAFFLSDPTWSLRGDELLLTSGEVSVRLVRTSE